MDDLGLMWISGILAAIVPAVVSYYFGSSQRGINMEQWRAYKWFDSTADSPLVTTSQVNSTKNIISIPSMSAAGNPTYIVLNPNEQKEAYMVTPVKEKEKDKPLTRALSF